MMEELTMMLNNVEDSYIDFTEAVLLYVKKKQSRFDTVKAFMDEHPEALSSDILWFISNQPDFFEDGIYNNRVG